MAEVLIVSNPSGSSAREHALAWKLSQSPEVKNVWLAPGNAGYKNSLPDLTTPEDFLRFAKNKKYLAQDNMLQSLKQVKSGVTKRVLNGEFLLLLPGLF